MLRKSFVSVFIRLLVTARAAPIYQRPRSVTFQRHARNRETCIKKMKIPIRLNYTLEVPFGQIC